MLETAMVTSFQLQRLEGDLSQEGDRRLNIAATAPAAGQDRGRLEARTFAFALDPLVVHARIGSAGGDRPHQLSLPLLGNTTGLSPVAKVQELQLP